MNRTCTGQAVPEPFCRLGPKIALAVRSVGDLETTKKDNPNELSRLVAGEGVIPGILGNALPQLEAVQI